MMEVYSLPDLGADYGFTEPLYYFDPTNCYVIASEGKHAAISDAPGEVDLILNFLADKGLTLTKILITHAHCEHIYKLKELAERTGAEVYMHASEVGLLTDTKALYLDYMNIKGYEPYTGNVTAIQDGDVIHLDEVEIEVIHVPGHSRGSVMYKAGNALISGDVLSHNAIGHHNMPGGNRDDMRDSVRKILSIKDNCHVYPAHWTETELREEQEGNLAEYPLVRLSATVVLGESV